MDKVSDTPKTDAFISKFYKSRPLSSGSRHRTDVELHDFARQLERELAAQKEHYRVLEEEMLVLGDERNAAVLDAERYQWLRNNPNAYPLFFIAQRDPNSIVIQFFGEMADLNIDAAMKEKNT